MLLRVQEPGGALKLELEAREERGGQWPVRRAALGVRKRKGSGQSQRVVTGRGTKTQPKQLATIATGRVRRSKFAVE